jgi:hypothetical protein
MELGDIFCVKTTGELVSIIEVNDDKSTVLTRRPSMTKDNGIVHYQDTFLQCEVETSEEHLRREANEMLIKEKIQNEFVEAHEKAQEAKVVAFKKSDLAVN